ncbi:MBL fold metallo-hydrolase [Cytobacillus purgationiresistens]|uniref:Glyoxylase-like metal-dependent hydrolase (Beta-lactamase superfamily II) n=1 Tax=Cytobacillus purgationiresistens TaxID=863449 RepID=A0ABU0AEV2_9BACI|nr:MBL fold metallo-hydrolase [Cytobacillus purgationiresistens]MDQ0269787.1 glyoxylase-like metal-dependent hydrolase (beta-lactamase superfamily II) [Cytobacillus purgationiresistens]
MLTVYKHDHVICAEGGLEKNGKVVRTIFSFIVDGMVVDTGPKNLEKELIPFYEKNTVDQVVLTHSHEDHSGNCPWFAEEKGLPIYAHSNGLDICAQDTPYPKYRQMTWGKRAAFKALPLSHTIESINDSWEVIYTPGHADDHVSLYSKERGMMFSGDLYVNPQTRIAMNSESIPSIIHSLKKLLKYDFDSMFCAHSGYHAHGKKQIQHKIDYLEQLYKEVANLYITGNTVIEIREKLFPKRYGMIQLSDGEWDTLHIVSSIVADIEKRNLHFKNK